MRVTLTLRNILLLTCFALSSASHASTLRLVFPQFPPYTSETRGVFSGIGIDLVEQVMAGIDVNYHFRVTPNYARALEELRRGQADGFFLASENNQRNDIAVFSEPLLINRWSWFLRRDNTLDPHSENFKSNAKVATIHGSNTHKWLIKNHYQVTTKANSAHQFPILLLDRERIDAVFLSSVVFNDELASYGYWPTDYVEVIEKSKEFGIYISKAYLENHPDFMQKLNAEILKVQDLK